MNFDYKNSALVSEEGILEVGDILKPYIDHLSEVDKSGGYDFVESSINLPNDEEILKNVLNVRDKMKTGKEKYVFVIGVGGSNLGAKAIYDALFGFYDNLNNTNPPKIVFLDTVNAKLLRKALDLIESMDEEEFLINVISKSGNTTETIYNFEYLLSQSPKVLGRTVVTTTKNNEFWKTAEEKGVPTLSLPEKVGGRFSVFSSVGLFPLSFLSINLENLLKGAADAKRKSLNQEILSNPSAVSAVLLYKHYKDNKNVNDNFIFTPELESLGKWYRQLMGESLGKENKGITPTVSIGSIDLHSVTQLYLGGPEDKYFTFIYGGRSEEAELPSELSFPHSLDGQINNRSPNEIMDAIFRGVKKAFLKRNIPFSQVSLQEIKEEELGRFMQFKMIEMMYLGKLMNINTFNQPNVEEYKEQTRNVLKSRTKVK